MSTFPHTPEIKKSWMAYEGYFCVQVDEVAYPASEIPLTYERLLCAKEAAVVIAETEEGRLVINREYRHPARQWLYGLPGGRVDPGEDPLGTAQRELLEEGGYAAAEWRFLGSAFSLPAVCDQKIHYYLARSARFIQEPMREPMELISTQLMTPGELFEEIRKGAPTDGILLTALALFSQHG